MATTTGTFIFYQSWAKRIGTDSNLSSDTFKLLLTTSSYTPSASTHEVLADITNEVSGNGYAQATLGSVTFNEASGVATFDSADAVFTASGGSIVARYWVLYNDTPTGDPLIAYGLLNNAVADVTIASGNTGTFTINASGLFTVTAN